MANGKLTKWLSALEQYCSNQ